jgi:DNA-binding transcriptional LysR family regulator
MDWNELRTFLAVAAAGSFSRAAEQLHITQPAVSKRIQTLESSLGVRLFDRVGKRVHLTDAGRILEPRAKHLIADVGDIETSLRNLHERVDGRLRLATSHHIGLHRLAPALRTYAQQFPAVDLEVHFVDSEDAHDLVAAGDVEIAVVTLDPAGDPRVEATPLWRDPLDFVVAEDHPLAGRTAISLVDLGRFAAILPGLGTYTGRIVAERFHDAGVTLRSAMATNYLETIGMLVGIGLGWSVLPRTMVKAPITRLPVDCEPLGRTLGRLINPARTLSNPARAFGVVLAGYADPSPQPDPNPEGTARSSHPGF